MFRALSITLLAGFWLLLAYPQSASADKEIFIEHKCNKCHSIASEGIEKKTKKKKEESKDKIAPPDLSDVGKYHDAAFFAKFLKKKTVHILHDGKEGTKKHKKKFKGSDEELKKLTAWLESLKNDVP